MNRLNMVLVAGLLVTAVGVAHAQESATVQRLGWLAGCWSGTFDGIEMEELWLSPRGGVMLGLHRDTKNGRPAGFEFLRIAQSPSEFRVQSASIRCHPEQGRVCGRGEGPRKLR